MEKTVEQLVTEQVEEQMKMLIPKIRASLVPHTCFTCKWFIMREEKPRNKCCRCPTPLKVKGRACLNWELQEDASKRSSTLC